MSLLYPLVRPLVFLQDAETAHESSLELLNSLRFLIPARQIRKPVRVMGLDFPNPVGLAAGMDKNADYLGGLSRLGFGFIEVGTITPRPQPGNPKPRLFRVKQHHSIINRMGFNNKGVTHLINNLQHIDQRNYILGVNIGKNLTTAVDNALEDYSLALEQVYPYADYVAINISSPNTPGLRDLQGEQALQALLQGLTEKRKLLQDRYQVYKPLALKIAPDLDQRTIQPIADLLVEQGVDALIATNTTLNRSTIQGHPLAEEAGGLSGEALTQLSREVLHAFNNCLQGTIPIISSGGIASPEEAQLRLDLGASLVQLYSALIYQGPGLISDICKSIQPRPITTE
jgi:dihydroorotate dehydrogenase